MSGSNVPCTQALSYTLQRAILTYDWLVDVNTEYQAKLKRGENASNEAKKMRILSDVFSVYVTTFIDGGKNRTLSLVHCWGGHDFKSLLKKEVIIKCRENRHNRSAHEADSYGHFIQAEEILQSDIKDVLNELLLFIGTNPPTNCE